MPKRGESNINIKTWDLVVAALNKYKKLEDCDNQHEALAELLVNEAESLEVPTLERKYNSGNDSGLTVG